MNVESNRLAKHLGRPLLCVVHSDRPITEPGNDINYLERRFGSALRLPPTQSFETLDPASAFSPYLGAITVYDIGDTGAQQPEIVCAFRPESYKPQHAMWHRDRLWVLGTEHIEVYDAHLESLKVIRDPWLAGNHTIAPDGRGRVLVSCSASDAVLVFDEDTGDLARVWRVPEAWYGHNYPLDRSQSVVDHYIDNDRQLTHINCAWPWRGGLLVSLLIQGAIGWSDEHGDYRELVRGFVGCHGARVRSDIEEIYFADSCSGMLVFLDMNGEIIRRVGTGSRWLHDAVQICGDLFAVAPFDLQEVRLVNVVTREVAGRISCAVHGGPQFLSFGGQSLRSGESTGDQNHHGTPELSFERAAHHGEMDPAELGRQHAATIRKSFELIREYSERIRTQDSLIAALREEQDLAATARDALLADLMAARERDVVRDAAMATLLEQHTRTLEAHQAIIDDLRRDLAFATRGWRRWVIGQRQRLP